MIDWLFRNRETGRLTFAQWPNLPLAIFMVATGVRLALHPHGSAGSAVQVVGTAGLVWWAVDELVRGVNPWRRLLGAGMLVFQLVALLR